MIFWTWRSYFICWQIFENKVWYPVSKKRRYFHFFTFFAYPIDRLDCNIVPSFVSSIGESWDLGLYFAPQLSRSFDHFYRAGKPPLPTARVEEPPLARGAGSLRGGASIPVGKFLWQNASWDKILVEARWVLGEGFVMLGLGSFWEVELKAGVKTIGKREWSQRDAGGSLFFGRNLLKCHSLVQP